LRNLRLKRRNTIRLAVGDISVDLDEDLSDERILDGIF
jgi:hypothetical protein